MISARNSLNEWGYQLRLDGQWWRRSRDPEVAAAWPVVHFSPQGAGLVRLSEADERANLATGIPLVINGIPSRRDFLIACCSDVAHMFDVDPRGRRGPSAEAWLALSNLWQELKDAGLNDVELAAKMESAAERLDVSPSHHLLHSVLAQHSNGLLMAFAITGSLTDIAVELAHRWEVQHAVLLDNGGSVGWQVLVSGAKTPALIVAAPNYRPKGMAFMLFDVDGFVHPQSHGVLERDA